MARRSALTARFVTSANEGRHHDGGGLILQVKRRSEAIDRSWIFRYRRDGKETWLGLGSTRDVTLAQARELARRCRQALLRGENVKDALRRPRAVVPTFGSLADTLIDAIAPGFKSEITVRNWRRTLGDQYCKAIRGKQVDEITTDDIIAVLRPHWQLKPETATKVRERIERVLDVAEAKGFRDGKNPARWKGHLKLMMPPQTAKKGHFRALPWQQLPDFIARLRTRNSVSALALEWTILTTARTAMTIGCPRIGEVDLTDKVWTIPAERMKEDREHRVPLVDRCIEIYRELAPLRADFVFPSRDPREGLSNMAMSECLRQMGDDATVHGFRSTFSDWGNDTTEFDENLIEQALSHQTGNEVSRAYRRGDALDRRRKLMEAWAAYCLSKTIPCPSVSQISKADPFGAN